MKFLVALLFASGLTAFTASENTNEYKVDPGHCYMGFKVERFVTNNVIGRFNAVEGTIIYDATAPEKSSAKLTIQTNSITTGSKQQEGSIKGPGFLHTSKFETITFVSKSLKAMDGKGQFMATGDLTIKDVTKEVSFPLTIKGPNQDPFGHTTVGLIGELTINRFDYNVAYNQMMENGLPFVGQDVLLTFDVLAIR